MNVYFIATLRLLFVVTLYVLRFLVDVVAIDAVVEAAELWEDGVSAVIL